MGSRHNEPPIVPLVEEINLIGWSLSSTCISSLSAFIGVSAETDNRGSPCYYIKIEAGAESKRKPFCMFEKTGQKRRQIIKRNELSKTI